MFGAIRRVLFWTFSRGSWQYDVLCGVILLFIFLTPNSVFDGSAFRDYGQEPASHSLPDPADETPAASSELESPVLEPQTKAPTINR